MSTTKEHYKFKWDNLLIKLFKTLVGFAVIFVILLITTSGGLSSYALNNVMIIFMASILCTAGIGAVVWVLLSYAVGSFIFSMLKMKLEVAESKTSSKSSIENYTVEQVAIINYIHQARKQHLKDEAISSMLKLNGWSEHEIKKGFDEAEK